MKRPTQKAKLELVEAHSGKDRILTCAMALFGERGFDGVSTRDIAAQAEVSVGLINHHFGSKEGLRLAVDEYFIAQFERFYEGEAGHVEDQAPGDVVRSIDQWVTSIAGEWPMFCRYFRRALLEETTWGAALFKRYFDLVRGSIDRLDAQGKIRPDVDRLWLPFLFMFLETGTLLMDPYIKQVLGRSGFEPDLWRRRYRAYGDLISQGIFQRGSEKEELR